MPELAWAVFVGPFKDMAGSPAFLVEVLFGGVAAGLMYSLVALGFVLIFKASGVFNFAQGVMVLFAALTLVGLLEHGVPVAPALALTALVMVGLAFAVERIVLRPLVNQEHIILFMATIGLNFFLEGFGEMVWGSNVKRLDIGIPDRSFMVRGVQINQLELTAAITAAVERSASDIPMSPAGPMGPAPVPLPDLTRFDLLLARSHPGDRSDEPDHAAVTEGQPEAAQAADHAGRAREAGP